MDERDMVGSVRTLIDAWTTIGTAVGEYLDESLSPLDMQCDAQRIQQWNSIYAGASDMLLGQLIPSVDDEEESLLRYVRNSFGKAQSLKQLMG
jgi:hypothetical protein